MPRIFISYRRADSQAFTDRIHERLVRQFGYDDVFQDVEPGNIPIGTVFADVLRQRVESSSVVLVIIGTKWATTHEAHDPNLKRIFNPEDYVHTEIKVALERFQRSEALVIPILVDNAQMPRDQDLPDDLKLLSGINAHRVRPNPDFSRDMSDLIKRLNEHFKKLEHRGSRISRRNLMLGVVAVAALVLTVLVRLLQPSSGSTTESTETRTAVDKSGTSTAQAPIVVSTGISSPSPDTPIRTASPTNTPPATLVVRPPSPTSTQPGTPIWIRNSFQAPGALPHGITWDGSSLWISDNSSTIFRVDPSGKVQQNVQSPEPTPEGLTWSGESFWLFTTNRSLIYEFQVEGREVIKLRSFKSPNRTIGGRHDDLGWDGDNLWYADNFNAYKLSVDGEILAEFALGREIDALEWDGQYLWVAHNDFPANATLSVVDTDGNVLASFLAPTFEINALAKGEGGTFWAIGTDTFAGEVRIYQLDVTAALENLAEGNN